MSIVSAGTAETSPAEEIQLAATATVIIMVFSMRPNSRRTSADAAEGLEDGEDDDHRRDVHAQAPAGFQADVEVRQRHQPAEDHAGQHRPDGEVSSLCRRDTPWQATRGRARSTDLSSAWESSAIAIGRKSFWGDSI